MSSLATFSISTVSNEALLWQSFKNGDAQAYELLYHQHYKVLTQYGFKIIQDTALVQDAIHDVFVDLWRRREHVSMVDHPKFYLIKALRNQLIRNTRHDVFQDSTEIDHFLDVLVSLSEEQKHVNHESENELITRLQSAIAQLSPRQQEVIHLRFYSGLSVDEISEVMQLTKQSVHNLLSRTYAVLRITIELAIVLIVKTLLFY